MRNTNKYLKKKYADKKAEESEKPFSAMKKAVAESKLKTYADLKGYSYDPDFWSEQIDGVVAVMNTQRDQAQSTK